MPGGGYESSSYQPPQPTYQRQPVPPPNMAYRAPVAPQGELVTLFTLANPNYRLTARDDGAVLAFKNSKDVRQHWIKVNVGPEHGGFVDREGQPGFILVSKATGLPLLHGVKENDLVSLHKEVYGPHTVDGRIIWTLGAKDEGLGFKGMRPVTNITLNLDAEHADRAHGGVRDGNRLVISSWIPMENLKWKIEPLELPATA